MSIFVVLKETRLLTLKTLHYGHSFTVFKHRKTKTRVYQS